MRGSLALLSLLLVLPGARASELTSPAVDATLYREGEVRRLGGDFGRWRVACDEVTRLRQRYCSLRTQMVDADGRGLAGLTVSTGDDGKPAALLQLPLGTALDSGVVVFASPPANASKGARKADAPRRLQIVSCEPAGCSSVWPLTRADLSALNDGRPIPLRYVRVDAVHPTIAHLDAEPRTTIDLAVPAEGFASAVAASLR